MFGDQGLGLFQCPSLSPISPLPCRPDPEESTSVQPGPSSEPGEEAETEAKGDGEGEAVLMEEDLIQQSLDDYDAGKYSPRLLGSNELPFDAHVIEAEEDLQRLLLLRQQLQVTGRKCLVGSCPSASWAWSFRGFEESWAGIVRASGSVPGSAKQEALGEQPLEACCAQWS